MATLEIIKGVYSAEAVRQTSLMSRASFHSKHFHHKLPHSSRAYCKHHSPQTEKQYGYLYPSQPGLKCLSHNSLSLTSIPQTQNSQALTMERLKMNEKPKANAARRNSERRASANTRTAGPPTSSDNPLDRTDEDEHENPMEVVGDTLLSKGDAILKDGEEEARSEEEPQEEEFKIEEEPRRGEVKGMAAGSGRQKVDKLRRELRPLFRQSKATAALADERGEGDDELGDAGLSKKRKREVPAKETRNSTHRSSKRNPPPSSSSPSDDEDEPPRKKTNGPVAVPKPKRITISNMTSKINNLVDVIKVVEDDVACAIDLAVKVAEAFDHFLAQDFVKPKKKKQVEDARGRIAETLKKHRKKGKRKAKSDVEAGEEARMGI
ncbi:hypothetical protein K458DRAFT_403215 [Lentithecium fluviatile CBS 122367]|uniref:Uncharacterized protein n=1 Tax=Lentithecium fluviatile CBS 122367 TaxID=1168545 RepID=A0A6G1J5U4_9PLEO|nr:hypothetical protein K458DRAFT_403215 [Lentithecium fluviatile CBS 122367]